MIVPWKAGLTAPYVASSKLHRFLTNSFQNFDKHIQDFYKSADFKKKSEDAQPFFKGVKDYVFGRPANLENIVRWFPAPC